MNHLLFVHSENKAGGPERSHESRNQCVLEIRFSPGFPLLVLGSHKVKKLSMESQLHLYVNDTDKIAEIDL